MKLRELRLDHSNEFKEDDNYSTFIGPNNYSWGFVQQFRHQQDSGKSAAKCVPDEERDKQYAVAVIVSLFIDGEAIRWREPTPFEGKCNGNNQVEIVTAYRMILLPNSRVKWTNFLIPAYAADLNTSLQIDSQAFSLSGVNVAEDKKDNASERDEQHAKIKYVVRRNLEHILGVCAIPVKEPLLDEQQKSSSPEHLTPIALTCGDISTHRVCLSASFFAFQFLIEVAKQLKKTKQTEYVTSLRRRIGKVCRGHLVWLLLKAAKTESGFASNYCVTGKIMRLPKDTSMPPDSLTDTPFQLIKAADFVAFYGGQVEPGKADKKPEKADEKPGQANEKLAQPEKLARANFAAFYGGQVELGKANEELTQAEKLAQDERLARDDLAAFYGERAFKDLAQANKELAQKDKNVAQEAKTSAQDAKKRAQKDKLALVKEMLTQAETTLKNPVPAEVPPVVNEELTQSSKKPTQPVKLVDEELAQANEEFTPVKTLTMVKKLTRANFAAFYGWRNKPENADEELTQAREEPTQISKKLARADKLVDDELAQANEELALAERMLALANEELAQANNEEPAQVEKMLAENDKNLAQADQEIAQFRKKLVLAKKKILLSDTDFTQADKDLAQGYEKKLKLARDKLAKELPVHVQAEKLALAEKKLALPNKELAQAEKKLVQAEKKLVQVEDLAQADKNLVQAGKKGPVFKLARADIKLGREVAMLVSAGWTEHLVKVDKRKRFAWRHGQDEDVNVFRLDDHVWIWKALKSVENLEVWSNAAEKENKSPTSADTIPTTSLSSATVQREMLSRFTTMNDVSRKRMLAVTRSSRDTRFMFHARDTVLFYAMKDWRLRLEEEVWQNTINAQAYHDENEDINWANSLRYALAIVMGVENYRINKRTPKELVTSALGRLFRATSSNGFFPSDLDMNTKEPILFDDEKYRDFYFHTSFEIPYVLLTRAFQIAGTLEPPATTKSAITERPFDSQADLLKAVHESLTKIVNLATSQPKHHLTVGELMDYGIDNAVRKVVMQKYIPFGSLVDMSNIVEVGEEWLYNYPSFFQQEKAIEKKEVKKQLKILGQKHAEYSQTVMLKAADKHKKMIGEVEDPCQFSDNEERALIADTKKKKVRSKQDKREEPKKPEMKSNGTLWSELSHPRTAKEAKKRFIWLPRANLQTALVCYLAASTEEERLAMTRFFERHAQYEIIFSDNTSLLKNTWESEFHLSFYQLAARKKSVGIPEPNVEEFPGSADEKLQRVSMGFRFYGDFFDRHWTCHYIQYIPKRKSQPAWEALKFGLSDKRKEQSWRQRKVLELRLLIRMLTSLTRNTQEILSQMQPQLKFNSNSLAAFTAGNSDEYFSSGAQWQLQLQILHIVADDLHDILKEVGKWKTREKDRGQERPRWTAEDEKKYREDIRKQEAIASNLVREVQGYYDKITNRIKALTKSHDNIRDDLSLRGSENIRFFTYVTIIFLPISFATSVFASGTSPQPEVLVRITILAVVTLLLTVLALLNIKTIVGVASLIVERVSLKVNKYSYEKKQSSYFAKEKERLAKEKENRKGGGETKAAGPDGRTPQQTGLPFSTSLKRRLPSIDRHWYLSFWISYLFMELPVRRVLLAFDTMKANPLSLAAVPRVVTGVVLLPVCIVSWLVWFCVVNAVDVLRLLWGEYPPLAYFLLFPSSSLFFLFVVVC
jgi:hypothetical protein